MKRSRLPFDPNCVPTHRVPELIRLYSRQNHTKNKTDSNQESINLNLYQQAWDKAVLELKERRAWTIQPEYPDLPICQRLDEIRQALKEHSIVIIEGETGSGKTTQIPKICLELGLSDRGMIGCTQPRRLAALSICDRLREELKEDSCVGSVVRFREDMPDQARVQVMTDGILLQEFRKDPFLSKYSCIILDEAHERSLNLDLLLGIMKILRERRSDLKIVITSATLDAELFQKFFEGAPLIRVEGRTYPVEIRWKDCDADLDLDEMISQTILELQSEKPDHLLCFLPTERDIQETQTLLAPYSKDFEILPLYARLAQVEQRKVFAPSSKPKIILTTNIAETSLTIPGISYVVDSGLARLSRYQAQTRIQGLPIEKISQASARQRAGRAGRVKPGICVRLYSEEDFNQRPSYTDPEILRSNLDTVVLQLRQLRLNPEDFPFPQAPARNALRQAFVHLWELGALIKPEADAELTSIGRQMAQLPTDAVLGRILISAQECGLLEPISVLCAALSLPEIRLNPLDENEKQKASLIHKTFVGGRSDFLTWLRMWESLREFLQERNSRNRVRQWAKQNFCSFQRTTEWLDLTEQFRRLLRNYSQKQRGAEGGIAQESAWKTSELQQDSLHMCLVSGLISGVAQRDSQTGNFRLQGSKEALLVSSSCLFRKKPDWLFAASIRETHKVYLSAVAEMDPLWIEKLFPHLCKTHWHAPFYNPDTGFVEAKKEIRFRTFALSKGQKGNYEQVDPLETERIFWRDGVAQEQLPKKLPFQEHNREILQEIKVLEHKLRWRGLSPNTEELGEHFRSLVPGIYHFKALKQYVHNKSDAQLRLHTETWISSLEQSKFQAWIKPGENLEAAIGRLYPESIELEFKQKSYPISLKVLWDPASPFDGISIDLNDYPQSYDTFSPRDLAAKIPVWRKWIWEAVLDANNKETRTLLDENQQDIFSIWESLLRNPQNSDTHWEDSVLHTLKVACSNLLEQNHLRWTIPRSWENHTRLHFIGSQQRITDLDPSMSKWDFFQKRTSELYRVEYRGKYALTDYDSKVLWSFGIARGPAFISQENKNSPSIKDSFARTEAAWNLWQFNHTLPLKQRYPHFVQSFETWIKPFFRVCLERAGLKIDLLDALMEIATGAYYKSLDEAQRLSPEVLETWKESLTTIQAKQSTHKSKGLENLGQFKARQGNEEERWGSLCMAMALCLGPQSTVLWQKWALHLQGKPQEIIQDIYRSKPSFGQYYPSQWDLRSLAWAKAYLLIDELNLHLQLSKKSLGIDASYGELCEDWNQDLNTLNINKKLKMWREQSRQKLLMIDNEREAKLKIQQSIQEIEDQAPSLTNAEIQVKWFEIQNLIHSLEIKAWKTGENCGSKDWIIPPDSNQSIHGLTQKQEPEKNQLQSHLDRLKKNFGKV
jgi:HrpA-like RNA helicase